MNEYVLFLFLIETFLYFFKHQLLSDNQEEANIFSRYFDRCDVALLSLLEHVTSGRTIMVCNTHLVWESTHISDVRCIQVRTLDKQAPLESGLRKSCTIFLINQCFN